jgi:hypothetical protein
MTDFEKSQFELVKNQKKITNELSHFQLVKCRKKSQMITLNTPPKANWETLINCIFISLKCRKKSQMKYRIFSSSKCRKNLKYLLYIHLQKPIEILWKIAFSPLQIAEKNFKWKIAFSARQNAEKKLQMITLNTHPKANWETEKSHFQLVKMQEKNFKWKMTFSAR